MLGEPLEGGLVDAQDDVAHVDAAALRRRLPGEQLLDPDHAGGAGGLARDAVLAAEAEAQARGVLQQAHVEHVVWGRERDEEPGVERKAVGVLHAEELFMTEGYCTDEQYTCSLSPFVVGDENGRLILLQLIFGGLCGAKIGPTGGSLHRNNGNTRSVVYPLYGTGFLGDVCRHFCPRILFNLPCVA